jgi:hypothetical protein
MKQVHDVTGEHTERIGEDQDPDDDQEDAGKHRDGSDILPSSIEMDQEGVQGQGG